MEEESAGLKRMKVLLIGDGRQALPFLRALKRAGHHVAIACQGRLSIPYFSRYPDRRLLWANYSQDPGTFTSQLLCYLRRHRPDVTLALEDIPAGILSRNKAQALRYTHVSVPDPEVFDLAADKAKTMAFCMANDIPCPRTYFPDYQDLESILALAPMPLMVKPRRGIGAIGLHRVYSGEELRKHYPLLRERYGELIIQELIPLEGGTQFQAEAFLSADSKMKACLVIAKPRFFPVTGGTSSANVTIWRPDIQQTVRRLLEGIGWQGAADVDLILDPRDNVPKVLEINPRVTAGIKIGFVAGIDYADLDLRLATGRPVPEIPSYRLGVCLRNLSMEALWYLFSDRQARRSSRPPFFHFFGRDVYYQNFGLDDPMPAVGFLLSRIVKFSSPQAWKAKLGKDLGGTRAG